MMNAPIPYDLRSLGKVCVRSGPSWRIVAYVVGGSIKAYGIYPGGQSENPFSDYYRNFFNTWYMYEYRQLDLLETPQAVGNAIAMIIMTPSR